MNRRLNGAGVTTCCDTPRIFDGVCYLQRYPDVAADGKYNTPDKALDHWLTYGQNEGRIPGCDVPAGCKCEPVTDPGSPAPVDNTTDTGGGIMEWINKNEMAVAVGLGLVLFLLSRSAIVNRRKRRR